MTEAALGRQLPLCGILYGLRPHRILSSSPFAIQKVQKLNFQGGRRFGSPVLYAQDVQWLGSLPSRSSLVEEVAGECPWRNRPRRSLSKATWGCAQRGVTRWLCASDRWISPLIVNRHPCSTS